MKNLYIFGLFIYVDAFHSTNVSDNFETGTIGKEISLKSENFRIFEKRTISQKFSDFPGEKVKWNGNFR